MGTKQGSAHRLFEQKRKEKQLGQETAQRRAARREARDNARGQRNDPGDKP
jgi:hypothetical protein